MCGRFAMNDETNALLEQIAGEHGLAAIKDWQKYWPPNYNVAPTQQVPIVRQRHGARQAVGVRWGIVPFYEKQFGGGPPHHNAKLETADQLTMFKRAFAAGRCIVPALGYYEWQAREDGKQPYFIRHPDQPLGLAGIVSAWRDKSKPEDDPDAYRLSMSILTLDAHVVPGEVHDRMPGLLTPDAYDDWLGDGLGSDELKKLVELSSNQVAEDLIFYTVTRAVNKSMLDKETPNNDPSFVEPLAA